MNNYQLKRTNVLMGGQMKFDLVINNRIIDETHITAISPAVPDNKYVSDNLLLSPHRENIQKFYKKTSSSFYKDFVDPRLKNIYPLYDEYSGPVTDTTYDSGMKPVPEGVQIYNKKFEWLCPIWLEQVDDKLNNIKFKFRFYSSTRDGKKGNLIYETVIKMSDKISQYYRQYITDMGLNNGCNWVLDVNRKQCVVTGFNVKTGTCTTKTLHHFYDDLIYRERPLLEFNSLLIDELSKNNLITRQLFNFNLCFNFEDIASNFMIKEVLSNNSASYIMDCVAIVNEKELPIYDWYTNHEYIPKHSISLPSIKIDSSTNRVVSEDDTTTTNTSNVLDYLMDDKYLGFVDKNKISQNVCHWCLSDNPSENFNMYAGFTLQTNQDSGETTVETKYYNGKTPNLTAQSIDDGSYPYWCNNYKIDCDISEESILMLKLTSTEEDINKLFSEFSSNCWVNNIHYKTSDVDKTYVAMFHCNSNMYRRLPNIFRSINGFVWDKFNVVVPSTDGDTPKLEEVEDPKVPKTGNIEEDNKPKDDDYPYPCYILATKDLIGADPHRYVLIFMDAGSTSFHPSQVLYLKTLTMLKKMQSEKENASIEKLYNILSCPNWSTQSTIRFQNGLNILQAPGPSYQTSEIVYHKGESNCVIVRNFGKIKPMFVDNTSIYKNYKYKKLSFNELPKNYFKYSITNYEPKYPSLGYYAFAQINE